MTEEMPGRKKERAKFEYVQSHEEKLQACESLNNKISEIRKYFVSGDEKLQSFLTNEAVADAITNLFDGLNEGTQDYVVIDNERDANVFSPRSDDELGIFSAFLFSDMDVDSVKKIFSEYADTINSDSPHPEVVWNVSELRGDGVICLSLSCISLAGTKQS